MVVMTLWTLTAVAIATVTTVWTTVAALTTLGALTALTTLTGRALYITLGLLDQHTVRKFVLTGLRVDLQQFHLDLVTLLDAGLLDGLPGMISTKQP